MSQDQTDKLKNILCEVHSKKIQFINVGPETERLFICSDCLKKDKKFCMTNMNDFLSIDEFKQEYLKKITGEMEQLKVTAASQIDHLNTHLKDGLTRIDEDFETLRDGLLSFIKNSLGAHKMAMVKRYTELNSANVRSLESLIVRIGSMISATNNLSKELNTALVSSIEDHSKLQRVITNLMVSRKEFGEVLKDMKIFSASFTARDIEAQYTMSKENLDAILSRIKERFANTISHTVGTEEFREETVKKPSKNIKDIKVRSSPVTEVGKFEKLKSASLKYLGAFELSKHASHHVLSNCSINGVFMATGHADSTFKIWLLNPRYFDTPFSSSAKRPVTADEILISGTSSGTVANFKKKDVTELKPDSQILPLELVSSNLTIAIHITGRVPQALRDSPKLRIPQIEERHDTAIGRCKWRAHRIRGHVHQHAPQDRKSRPDLPQESPQGSNSSDRGLLPRRRYLDRGS